MEVRTQNSPSYYHNKDYQLFCLPGSYCSGELIFEDNFDWLDEGKWQHEITLAGGGVSLHQKILHVNPLLMSYYPLPELGIPMVCE